MANPLNKSWKEIQQEVFQIATRIDTPFWDMFHPVSSRSGRRLEALSSDNQTWQWKIPYEWRGYLIGKSLVDGPFSSTPCFIPGG